MRLRRLPFLAAATLRIGLALQLLVAVCLGQSHLLHMPAPEPDQCRNVCPRHMAPESADHGDPIGCGACTWAAHLGQDHVPAAPIVTAPAPVPTSPPPTVVPRLALTPCAASPRAPPLA